MKLRAPRIPVVANVDASFYPTGPDAPERIVDILGRQIGSPVQFVKGLEALYDAGVARLRGDGPEARAVRHGRRRGGGIGRASRRSSPTIPAPGTW